MSIKRKYIIIDYYNTDDNSAPLKIKKNNLHSPKTDSNTSELSSATSYTSTSEESTVDNLLDLNNSDNTVDNLLDLNNSDNTVDVEDTESKAESLSSNTSSINKIETIDNWVKDMNEEEANKLEPLAHEIYDTITENPKPADVLKSKMPFVEKCRTLEQIMSLNNEFVGTEYFFQKKKEIIAKIKFLK